jgi:stage V sporulation protein B
VSFLTERKKQTMLNGALILSLAVVLIKIIGVFYKMPLTSLIGAVGRGYFNSAYEIYTPIYAISMAGLPIAVARMVSENVALHRYNEARMVFKTALRIFFVIGILGTIVLLIISIPYTNYVAGPRNLPAVLAIAPSLFFCCIMSAYRGYYEGLQNMKPTAISQVFEALAKLVVGLGIAYAIVAVGLNQFNAGFAAVTQTFTDGVIPQIIVFGKPVTNIAEAYSVIYPISAAGAILGVTSGTVIGTLYLFFKYKIKGDGFTHEDIINSPLSPPKKTIAKRLIVIALPILSSSLVFSATNIIDTVTIQRRLTHAIQVNPDIIKSMYATSLEAAQTLDRDLVKYLWGAHGSSVDFKNLIPALLVSLGVSALPALSAFWAIKDKTNIKNTIESVLRITMLVALPAGIGIGVLAEPILTMIYGRGASADIIPIAAPLVATYGYATALISVSTPVTNMLQAIGRADIPLKALLLGAAAKIVSNYVLVGMPQYNINGAPFGSVLCYLIIVSINIFYLLKLTKIKPNIMSVFLKPLLCSSLCGVTAWSVYRFASKLMPVSGNDISVTGVALSAVLAMSAAVAVFVIGILLVKGIAKADVVALPKGEKIAKVLEKYRLLG